MTNLEIIKYLASNNPTRLAEFIDDIWCMAWNRGASVQHFLHIGDEEKADKLIDSDLEFVDSKWLEQEANTDFFFDSELEEWSKAINSTPTIEVLYDGLSVTLPVKDPDHMWNNNNEYDYEVTTDEEAL